MAPGTPPVVTDDARRDYQAEADAALATATDGLSPDEAVLAVAVALNRAATRLHNLARAEAAATKGTPVWPSWAALQNASRGAVLAASTCRDLAAKIAGRRR